MSAISRPAYRPQNRTRDFIIAVRRTPMTHPALACGHCGAGGMSMADFEAENGLPRGSVSKFLNRQPVRDDVAATIRANVKRVVE